MNDELKVLKIVAERLNSLNINYLISGSIAANYYTVPRMTRDIDIVIELQNKDINIFVVKFEGDFYIDKQAVEEAVSQKGIFNIIHNEFIVKVDLIIRKDTPFDKDCFSRRRKIKVEDIELDLISPEDLIIAKLLWARKSLSELQLKDVANIVRTGSELDIVYLEEWIDKFNLYDLYNKIKNG